MPKSPEQFDDIRKQKKQLIMDTALELFAENGFHATSISQIAAKAKISKGLFLFFLIERSVKVMWLFLNVQTFSNKNDRLVN